MHGELYTPLGTLQINDVFFYYDGPRIFTCKNESITFLAFLVDELDETDHWLFVPINQMRVNEIKRGKTSIRDAIAKSKDPIYEIFLPIIKGVEATFNIIQSSNVPSEYLPAEDSYILDKKNITYYSELPPKTTIPMEEAVLSKRDILDISIERLENTYEMPSLELGQLLTNAQYTLFGLDERWQNNQHKPPLEVIEDNTVNVTSFFESSFGIRIKSNKSSDIFNVTPASNSLRLFSELLEHSKSEEGLKQLLKKINPKAVQMYKEFLSTFEDDSLQLKIEWASPNNETHYSVLTSGELNNARKIVSTSIETVTETISETKIKGELIAVNIKRNTFYIEGADGKNYSGFLSKEIAYYVHKGYKFEVPKAITALLETKVLIKGITKKETRSYTLKEVFE